MCMPCMPLYQSKAEYLSNHVRTHRCKGSVGRCSRAVRAHATPGTCWHSLPARACCKYAIHCPERTCIHSFPLPARTLSAHAKRDVSAFIFVPGRVVPAPFISQPGVPPFIAPVTQVRALKQFLCDTTCISCEGVCR